MSVDVPFVKAHGLCNDYLIVAPDALASTAEHLATAMCNRRMGIGADGLIVLDTQDVVAGFRIFNADGTEAELCGNGLRCAAAVLARSGVTSPIIQSAVGEHRAEVERCEWGGWQVSMELVPAEVEPDVVLAVGGDLQTLRVVRVGNPHALVLLQTRPKGDLLTELIRRLDGHERFPDGVNLHAVWPSGPQRLWMLSWERGVGPVKACATGAAAAVAAVGGQVGHYAVEMLGGILGIEILAPDAAARMVGPVEIVCDGVYRYAAERA
jgi:diaminopimelate epimerase